MKVATWPAISCLNNYSDDCLAQPLTIKGGYVQVPDAPGLGVEIDEAAISRYRVSQDNWWIEYPRKLLFGSVARWPYHALHHHGAMLGRLP